jgi:hypothetical protein
VRGAQFAVCGAQVGDEIRTGADDEKRKPKMGDEPKPPNSKVWLCSHAASGISPAALALTTRPYTAPAGEGLGAI